MAIKRATRDEALLKRSAQALTAELTTRGLPWVTYYNKFDPRPWRYTEGWWVDLAGWPNGLRLTISLEKTMTNPERGFWVGFWSYDRARIKALAGSLGQELAPRTRLRLGDFHLDVRPVVLREPPSNSLLRYPVEEYYPSGYGNWLGKYETRPHKIDVLESADFVTKVINSAPDAFARKSAAATDEPYTRYVKRYETGITPKHNALARRFDRYLSTLSVISTRCDYDGVDIRFLMKKKGLVLAEVKPGAKNDVRFAIRTAMGQLMDYRQRLGQPANLMIVLGSRPESDDLRLAIENQFAVAFPDKSNFKLVWPASGRVGIR